MASEQEVGNIVYTVQMDVAKLISEQQKVNDRLDKMNSQFEKTGKTVDNTSKSFASLTKIAGALTAALSVSAVAQYADAWTSLNNKLANSVRAGESLVGVTERVFNITQATRSSLDATASLYARLERATREYGTSAGDLAKLTTIINQGFVVSGATAQEAENAIIQLSQGLAAGALRGEEFNSVTEQGSRLANALADSLGVDIGQLRAMAAQGQLTTDVVVNGLLSQGDAIGREFSNTISTIGQSLTIAGNNLTQFIGSSTTVRASVAIFNDTVVTLSENLDAVFTFTQHRAFMQWLRSPNYLDNCNQWFSMRLNNGTGDTGIEVQELHFTACPTWNQTGNIFTWSGNVICRKLNNADDEYDDIIVELPPPWGSWLDIIVTGYPDDRDPESLPRVP